ncbi:translational GTPase TypA [Planctomycetales bacterium ZRK34]|nr:translational GTPase TypA [Planctomycetales bacterium ZRK34]
MSQQDIRNVAIIAHVDHGKTTLVDALLRQSGQFREGELQGDCILDSNPIEKERGITILSKNCAIRYAAPDGHTYHINIVDTPGHADFGGEVERVLSMADGALLIVDAFEGPMPQTRFVLAKALALGLRPIVVINKMDRPEARPTQVHEEVFDLLVELGADDHALDFLTIYASGVNGWASTEEDVQTDNVQALFDTIIEHVPAPKFDHDAPVQMLVTTLDWSDYVGRIGIGRVMAGVLKSGEPIMRIDRDGKQTRQRIGKLYQFDGLGRREVSEIRAGDICAVVGLDNVDIGDTLADINKPVALPPVAVDEPTLTMNFRVNNSPFCGAEGDFVTSRQLRERLMKELQTNVAMRVEPGINGDEFEVSGRGMLHLGILLENMRREGYELSVGKPRVIIKNVDGQRMEPYEDLAVETPEEYVGAVMQLVGERRGEMKHMHHKGSFTELQFRIPARGLIGLRSRMLTASAGNAIMHHTFIEFGPYLGAMPGRSNGVMIATETGAVTGYALDALADRGIMFVKPGDKVYEGQVVGEHNRDVDIPINVARKKQLTNMRNANKDATVTLKAPRQVSLEAALEYIEDDELVELTPQSIRIRKVLLKESDRKRESRRLASIEV